MDEIIINVTESVDNIVVEVSELGSKGDAGQGVPKGGAKRQRLEKIDGLDYNTQWGDPVSDPAGSDKAIQYNDGGVLQGSNQLRFDKNTNSLLIGLDTELPDNPVSIVKAKNSYIQVNIKNTSEGAEASSDYVCTADNGSDESHYLDMGINSSIYDVEEYSASKANDGYLINDGGDLLLAAGTEGNKINFAAGGTTAADIIMALSAAGLSLFGLNVAPSIYGTGAAPSAVGLPNGTLYFKYEV
jgi:hypothetical protein